MRAACRKYLDSVENLDERIYIREPFDYHGFPASLSLLLGELRGVFGTQILLLSSMYGVDVEDKLVELIPAEDEN